MMKKLFLLVASLPLCFQALATMPYETYLESWNASWEANYQGLPPEGAQSYQNVTLNISFASYVFGSGPPYGITGLQFSTVDTDVQGIITYIHSHGGKVKLSFGGASTAGPYYFISTTPSWPNNASELATGIANLFVTYDFDGVDFDIEDSLPAGVTATEFASQLITFLQAVRAALPAGTIISITVPGQGWNQYWQPLVEGAAAIAGLIDVINFMEYDIYVSSSLAGGYPAMIAADISTYTSSPDTPLAPPNWLPGWNIPASKVNIGLMPGTADNSLVLTLADAQKVVQTAVNVGAYGVMTWDIDRDAVGQDGQAPYAFSTAIRQGLANGTAANQISLIRVAKTRSNTPPDFVAQPVPPHGAP